MDDLMFDYLIEIFSLTKNTKVDDQNVLVVKKI